MPTHRDARGRFMAVLVEPLSGDRWLVGIGAAATGEVEGAADVRRSRQGARRAALALAARSGLLVLVDPADPSHNPPDGRDAGRDEEHLRD